MKICLLSNILKLMTLTINVCSTVKFRSFSFTLTKYILLAFSILSDKFSCVNWCHFDNQCLAVRRDCRHHHSE